MQRSLGLLLLLASCSFATPITIISITGSASITERLNGPTSPEAQYAAVDWTMGGTGYTNVTINAILSGHASDLLAYLSTSIGSGATIVATSSHIVLDTDTLTDTTLFTGLTLLANTHYFLTLGPDNGGTYQWANLNGTQTLDTGVTYGGAHECNGDAGNCNEPPPSSLGLADSNFDLVDPLLFSVVAQDVRTADAPEPSTLLLALGGICVALPKLKKRW